MVVLVVLLGLAVVVLAWRLVRAHVALAELRAERDRADDVGLVSPHPDAVDVIAVEIRNHQDVAADRSPLARPLALVSPALVRTLVHRETVRQMRTQLAGQGIEADVRVRRVVRRDLAVRQGASHRSAEESAGDPGSSR